MRYKSACKGNFSQISRCLNSHLQNVWARNTSEVLYWLGKMAKEKRVGSLGPGNAFRNWLMDVLGGRIYFHCALLMEYVEGRSLYKYMQRDDGLYDRLTAIAEVQRKLHDQTRSDYRKDRVFAGFHRVLDQLGMDPLTRMKYNRLLGEWWYSPLLDRPFGCMVHGDANPINYLFNHSKVFVLDLESSKEHAHFVHDLGLIAAELKHYFAVHRGNGNMAEPYIGHYLWRYSRNDLEFYAITRVLPFFMGLGFLRMARLGMAPEHRAYILQEANACLKSGLRSQG